MRERRLRALTALAILCCARAAALAQSTLPQVQDVTTPRRGVLLIHFHNSWERSDSRYTANGTEPLGTPFVSESLGVANIPELASVENAVQAASASPFKLTMGRSQLTATARTTVIPFGFEYGVTDR